MSNKDPGASRRDFLKLAGTATPVAALAVAGGATEAQAQKNGLSDWLRDARLL